MRQVKEKTGQEFADELEQLQRQISTLEKNLAEQQQKVDEVRQQNVFFTKILYSIPFRKHVIDARDFSIKFTNPAARRGALSKSTKCYSYIHGNNEPCGKTDYVCLLEQVKKAKKHVVVEHTDYDEAGNPRYVELLGFPIFDAKGNVVYMVETLVDISKRKQAEAQLLEYQKELRSLASQLSLAEERERRRIATVVHDRISQTMAVCSMKLGALLELAKSTRFVKDIDEIHSIIKQMISDTRALTFEISSPLLYELGLDAAIEQLTEQMGEQCGIKFNFISDRQSKPLDNDVRVLVFQAVRELLVNAMKHSQASHIDVNMEKNDGYLYTTVEDDGIGFDTSQNNTQSKRTKGFGLFSIRERLHFIGGHMEVEAGKGSGTRVVLTVPLQQD